MTMARRARKHRRKLHVLRDRLKRAIRAAKHHLPGAAERVADHTAKRASYRASRPSRA